MILVLAGISFAASVGLLVDTLRRHDRRLVLNARIGRIVNPNL